MPSGSKTAGYNNGDGKRQNKIRRPVTAGNINITAKAKCQCDKESGGKPDNASQAKKISGGQNIVFRSCVWRRIKTVVFSLIIAGGLDCGVLFAVIAVSPLEILLLLAFWG